MEKVAIELNESQGQVENARIGFLEKVTFVLLLLIPFLLPLFFIPSASFPFQESKALFLGSAVLVAFAFWIIARLKDGTFSFPKTSLYWAGGVALSIFILAGLFSGSIAQAFVGQMVDLGTVRSMALFFLIMFLIPSTFKSKDKIFYAYLAFFASFFLLAIFQLFRLLFGVDFLSGGIFTDITSNTVGKWNDLGIFFGVGTVLSLITLELISLSKLFKVLAYTALAISLFFLAVINFSVVWYVIALFSLIFLVYVISFDKSEIIQDRSEGFSEERTPQVSMRRIPMNSLVVLLISLVFILGGSFIGSSLSEKFGITQLEVRPSWGATLSIAKDVLTRDPFFGAGPSQFTKEWLVSKPDGINSTIFWNTDFSFGVGLLPTFIITTGLLGVLSWVLFLGAFLYVGFRSVLTSVGDKISRYLITSSFLVSLFLWIMNVFYLPSLSIVALTFFFTGLFIASLVQGGLVKQKVISFIEDPRKGFVSVLVLILLLIGSITVEYSFAEKFLGVVYSQSATALYATDGNIDTAETTLLKATNFSDNNSAYYRALAQLSMLRMSNLLAQDSKSISQDDFLAKFQGLFKTTLSYAEQAVSIDQADYKNWVSLGQVYEAVVPLKVANAYESADAAYQRGLALNPKSPAILLTLGRLEFAHEDNVKAKEYIVKALQMKNNYTDAIFLLAQIQIQEGNLKDAISSVEAAAILAPNDSGTFFQLGLLRYNDKNYVGAASALKQAVALNPQYANAKYFLGLSYYMIGDKAGAVKEFTDLQKTNPDNTEIALILKNLNEGKDPFTNATPPIDNTPEKRTVPPVSETDAMKGKAMEPAGAN
ncbi:MAG: tetratricopeptide repeat protein [Candidatus Taylorbacteria bacterium]|nr:tetratricopeptide repeat protein [Candidatus Taylorbacteria bacterium]